MRLHYRILAGMALGVAAGLAANLAGTAWLKAALGALEIVGTAFIRLITMVVVPLIVASIISGTASLGDFKKLGRIGGKMVVFYVFTTCIAVVLSLVLSHTIQPGGRLEPATRDALSAQFSSQAAAGLKLAEQTPSVKDFLLNIIPRNPVEAAARFDLLPLVFFSALFGTALSVIRPEPRQAVLRFFEGVNEVSIVLIHWVMKLAPYAVFALIASVIARFGLDILSSLFVYSLTVLLGLALHQFGVLAVMVRVLGKMDPRLFFRRTAGLQLFAFSTSSSNASLPLAMETAEQKLGVPKNICGFVLPLGSTINQNGTALYQAVSVMFIAQIYGIPLDLKSHLMIVLTATLTALGAAGVPSSGIVTLIIVLQSVGMGGHIEGGIALILGVERILDMARTVVNVVGDLVCAVFVSQSEGELSVPEEKALTSVEG
jgi:DAACS family dicarboxylate/amino acid:cation (Na+ or H+) symporter